MALKSTVNTMKKMIAEIQYDLDKAEEGNKAAAKRVRIGTIKFAKVSKIYRKESVAAGKKGGSRKKKRRR
jgi:hypothetical protein